jgi:hypothetical protein
MTRTTPTIGSPLARDREQRTARARWALPGELRGALWMAAGQLLLCCSLGEPALVISEFVAANTSGLTDAEGDSSDWIEVHNPGKKAVDLEGWCLTDNPQVPRRWCFPAATIPPQAYLVVFASGKPSSADGQLHATFRLKATEDYLALVAPSGRIVHEFAPYPDQKPDVAFGLTAAGNENYLSQPTPGAPNR